MADVFTKAKRSEVMSRIRGRGNKDTELALAKLLRANGIKGWRRQVEIRVRARSPLRAVIRETNGEHLEPIREGIQIFKELAEL